MNNIKIKKKIDVNKYEILEYYLYNADDKVIINLNNNSKLNLYQYNVNKSFEIEINLNGEEAEIEYHLSTINYDDNNIKIKINHKASKTISNIYNHGVNIKNNKLQFDISGKVSKKSNKCICNQENQIINLQDGKSTILPKLLIDNYDVLSSHAAYIGKFKDNQIFYMMSRGIEKKQCYKLLISGLLINSGDKEKEEVIKFKKEINKI